MSDVILQVEHLSKQYPDTSIAAIHDISLSVYQGEIMALTGPSGAGKTTLLCLMAGLLQPDKGSIYLREELVNTYAEELIAGHPDIHLVFQDFKLFPNHTVQENIAYPLRYYDRDTQESRTQELLQLFHLHAFAQKYPRELSGGQQQRVALAKSMAAEPEVLLLDEPFSQIDGKLKQEIKQALKHLVKEYDTTLIFVTHDTSDALSFADRIALINHGQMIQLGSPQNLYQKPTNQFVSNFFGICNVLDTNNLPSRITSIQGQQKLACIRPEQLSIVKKAEADFSGKVTQQYFMGSHYIINVEIASHKSLQVFSLQPKTENTSVHLKITGWHWVNE